MITDFENNCFICGSPKSEIHHLVFGVSLRELADEDKLVVPCCQSCHKAIHENSVAAKMSKIIGQLQFEQNHTRKEFLERYGRSYL